ncbi:HET-domain-containing protein [Westerdykella ornata]|uniref:HET-domain-containing protein n=1 Tax=Westerdykella ornata TaxID=318751 RepID=A0A6A6J7A8_WESOR|nr:HET-domain-containing protein [Westerdykella ornata]KAF2272450.1 HET-domain-containing protein [Westerdykella ornata]
MDPRPKENICSVCRYDDKGPAYAIVMLQPSLYRSASAGCELCTLILRGIHTLSDLNRGATGVEGGENRFLWRPGGQLANKGEWGNRTWDTCDFYVLPGSFNPFPTMIRTACHLPGDSASDLSVVQVQRWLRRCSAAHRKCGSVDLDVPLPTRLIDVGSGLRLVETKGMRGRYVCLSHCWGDHTSTSAHQAFKTTRKNLDANLEKIEFTSLPKTYREAITFTRKLELRYIWIDSLCIIQDDEDDWRHEASLMANVYENAVLTLGATASASNTEGLFRVGSSTHRPIELRGETSNGEKYTVYARRALDHWIRDQPLFQRAWIFQERYLSPRFLHFTSNELIWECKECIDCECNQNTLLGAPKSNLVSYYNDPKSSYPDAFTASPYRVQVAWRDVVSAYTKLNLSYARDTLPAVSGIAKKFMGIRPGDRYLAGLWESSFVQDLLWNVISIGGTEKERIRPRPEKWRAPTWSWASVDSAVTSKGTLQSLVDIDEPGTSPCVEVVAVDCTPAGHDITGELSSAHAILRGWIMAGYISLKLTPNNYWQHYMTNRGDEARFFPNYRFDVDDESRVQDGDGIFCLWIATPSPKNWRLSEEFLVLRRKSGVVGTFERIGLMRLSDDDDFYRMFESLREECTLTMV